MISIFNRVQCASSEWKFQWSESRYDVPSKDMSRPSPVKHFVLAFVIAIVLYFFCFRLIEHRRVDKGPWEVTFSADASSPPSISLRQTNLALADIKIVFPGAIAAPTNYFVRFDHPQTVPFAVPFGACIFEDLIFQPGTLVFRMYGHEIQLLPRVLTIDNQEHAWKSGETISLTPVATNIETNKANISPAVP
jgi:hypothetical protein